MSVRYLSKSIKVFDINCMWVGNKGNVLAINVFKYHSNSQIMYWILYVNCQFQYNSDNPNDLFFLSDEP